MAFWKAKPVPTTVLEQQLELRATRFNMEWAITYERKRLPGPGAQNYAYETLGLPEFTPIGAGDANQQQFRVTQPQAAYALQTVPLQGVGGLSVGAIYGVPLIDTNEQGPPYG